MKKPTLSEAAALLGRKGGKAGGKSKSRTGISERMKAWWASPAAAHRRKKKKASYVEETYVENDQHKGHGSVLSGRH
jgi:hypothetical protein